MEQTRTAPRAQMVPDRSRDNGSQCRTNRRWITAMVIYDIILIAVVSVLAVNSANNAKRTTEMRNELAGASIGQTTEVTITAKNEAPETAPETAPEPAAFFYITEEERILIEQVVSAESRGEPYEGQVAVAQCILNACLKDDITPEQVFKKYRYTRARADVTDSVKEAVAAVFDRGENVTDAPILYFYNPAIVDSPWHESQDFVIEIANHKFFKEAE